jgi:H+-translocating NAD(P) transhydrogenase subunit beta
MSGNLAALLYLIAGSLFIMALRGLSSPATSRTGNMYGMVGMAIAVLTTLALAKPSSLTVWLLILVGIGIGAVIGGITAKRIPMTALSLPQPSTHPIPLASQPMA